MINGLSSGPGPLHPPNSRRASSAIWLPVAKAKTIGTSPAPCRAPQLRAEEAYSLGGTPPVGRSRGTHWVSMAAAAVRNTGMASQDTMIASTQVGGFHDGAIMSEPARALMRRC